jgi:NAD(P)-dependent dehydrogenase (short-subunit alcohol dehydrogenase family)
MTDHRRRRVLRAALLSPLAALAPPAIARDLPAAAPGLGAGTTAEQATAGLDLRGRTVLVTGCNSGIGLETMRVLALRGAHVIGTARSPDKGLAACASVRGRATPVVLDLELARRLRGTGATSNSVTPGHTRTAILRNTGNGYREDARTPAQGAATPCYAAVHPAMAGVSGRYLRDFRDAEQSAQQRDKAMAARLWQVSRERVGVA